MTEAHAAPVHDQADAASAAALDRRSFLETAGGAATGFLLGNVAHAAAGDAVVRLRLLATSDLHMYIFEYDYFRDRPDPTVGLAATASLIAAARAEARNSLLFDNGDLLQGSPLGDYAVAEMARPGHPVHPMFRVMNRLGYDAATLGNHEFNYGMPFLDAALAGARFPYICANLEREDGRGYLRPSTILDRRLVDTAGKAHDFRIGIIGFLPPQITVWDRTHLRGRLRTTDIVDAARRHLPELRSRSDLVVALCHAGISVAPRQGGDENAALYLAQVPGIDAIVTGHAHRVLPGPDYAGLRGVDAEHGALAGVPAVMPGFWGSHLGVIDLTLARVPAGWRVADFCSEARPIYRRDHGKPRPLTRPQALDEAEPEHRATIDFIARPIGRVDRPIETYFALVEDDASVGLVNAAQLWYARPLLAASPHAGMPLLSAAAPFRAGGSAGPEAFVDIPAGPVAIRNVADIYVYPNTVQIVRVTGAGLAEWLERAAAIYHRVDPDAARPQPLLHPAMPAYAFDIIAGLTYAIDVTEPARYDGAGRLVAPGARRVRDIRHAGRPLDPAAEFAVVTNNYRASGGGHFPGLDGGEVIIDAPDATRDVIVRYIEQQGTITPAPSGSWRFAKPRKPFSAWFESSPAAARLLPAYPAIAAAGEGEDGFARYVLTIG